jgi:hypothetical protein
MVFPRRRQNVENLFWGDISVIIQAQEKYLLKIMYLVMFAIRAFDNNN